MGRQFVVIVVALFFIIQSFNGIALAKEDSHLRKGYIIDFKPPKIILDCGSLFYLNVSIQKVIPFSPPISIYVFFKTKDDYNRIRIQLIGYLPYVKAPLGKKTNVFIPCLTSLNLAHKIEYLKEGRKEELKWKEGCIGIKIDRASPHAVDVIDWFLLKKMRESMTNKEFWKWLFVYSIMPKRLLREMALMERWNNIEGWFKKWNRFIIWKKVNVSDPFVYSNDISMEIDKSKTANQTDKHGDFIITAKITNNLDQKIHVSVLADLTPEPFMNSLIPMAKQTRYNVGCGKADINASQSVEIPIKCHFPAGGWAKKEYLIRVECGPSIFIGNTNQFGIYTYNIRWGMLIKPNYKVNDTVMEEIKHLWYNLPIFSSSSKDMFPTNYTSVKYIGPAPEEALQTMVKNLSNNMTKAALLFFSAIAILIIVIPFTIYFLIRRKYL